MIDSDKRIPSSLQTGLLMMPDHKGLTFNSVSTNTTSSFRLKNSQLMRTSIYLKSSLTAPKVLDSIHLKMILILPPVSVF